MSKKIFTAQNFILVKERTSRKGKKGICVIRSSGYTSTVKGVTDSWISTQLKTVPHLDRSNLPDPFIAPQTMLPAYEELDCTVFNMYFLPRCKGLINAMKEFAEVFEHGFLSDYQKKIFVGHSKGGLFAAGIPMYLSQPTNIVMIAPTIGTIMGDEEKVFSQLEKYRKSQNSQLKKLLVTLEILLYKGVTKIVGSRRPVDYDMSTTSALINEELDLSKLSHHNTLLITAECPEKCKNFGEAVFKHYGKFLNLDRAADGMVTLENQMLASNFVDKEINIEATHPTILGKVNSDVREFLLEM